MSDGVFGNIIATVDQPATAATGADCVYNSTGAGTIDSVENTSAIHLDFPDAEMMIVVGKGGKVDFVGAHNNTLRCYHVEKKCPFDIESFLSDEKTKTLDQITIFSGSPSCVIRDGYMICS